MPDFNSAAPRLILRGTDDRSRRPLPRTVALRPTHYPLVYFWAQRGPLGPRPMVNGDQLLYGTDTFNPLSKFYNHATPFIAGFLEKGNAVMAERLVPEDAGPPAGVRVSLEYIKLTTTDSERNSDGSVKLVNGQPVPIAGSAITKHVARVVLSDIPNNDVTGFAKGTVLPGTMIDPNDPANVGEIVPLFDLRESSIGADGNLTAFNFFAPTRTTREGAGNPKWMADHKAFPLVFRVGRRAKLSSSPVVQTTLSGSRAVTGVLKNPAVDQNTAKSIHLARTFVKAYNRINSSTMPDEIGYIDDIAVYQSNLDRILGEFVDAEKAYIAANPAVEMYYDFSDNGEDERHLMNIFGGCTYNDYPYHTYELINGADGFRPTPNQWVSLRGGSDGTINDVVFGERVGASISEYANSYSPRQDDARRVESIFYDSGFAMEDKYKLLNFLGIRKDLALVLSTHIAGEGMLSAEEEYLRATALRTRATLYPESVDYGTGVSRVSIWGRSGELIGSDYDQRVPGSYEFALKSADFMGAGNRVWRESKRPGGYPNSLIEHLTNVNVTWTPVDQRVLDWDTGLNWIQAYDQNSLHIPAYKSVYGDDSSVLTSWWTVMAIVEINKVCQLTHRRFSGVDHLTNGQLASRVDAQIAQELQSVFNGAYRIEVETIFTDADIDRNYSWTTIVRLGANGAKTVMTATVEAYRREDLEG